VPILVPGQRQARRESRAGRSGLARRSSTGRSRWVIPPRQRAV